MNQDIKKKRVEHLPNWQQRVNFPNVQTPFLLKYDYLIEKLQK